jgi:fluoride exporter
VPLAPRTLVAVALGGAVGSLLRWLLELLLPAAAGTVPWPTFLANVLGSAVLGVVVVVLDRGVASAALRGFLTTGLLGGFTTFSFYAVQVTLLGHVAPALALTYLMLTPLACVGAAWLAAAWARRIWGMP